jgi:hypothetical protein
MMTKVWGPAGWLFLHCVTFGYPIDPDKYDHQHGLPPGSTRRHYTNFFNEVGKVLPCRYCRDSYLEYARENPVEKSIHDRESLIKWLYHIHNRVNDKLGANYFDVSIESLKTRYEAYRAKCKALSVSEIQKNEEKGCLTPADGTPKRCLIEVIKTDKGDVTRRNNASLFSGSTDDPNFPITSRNKKKTSLLLILVILVVASFGVGLYVGKYLLRHAS